MFKIDKPVIKIGYGGLGAAVYAVVSFVVRKMNNTENDGCSIEQWTSLFDSRGFQVSLLFLLGFAGFWLMCHYALKEGG